MRIYIPTRARTAAWMQKTWDELSPELRERTNLVVDHDERTCGLPNLIAATKKYPRNIGGIRTFIYDHHRKTYPDDPFFVMLDDDLRFFMRRQDDPTKFVRATHEEQITIFDDIERQLSAGFAQVSMLAREGANRITTKYMDNYRPLRVYAYDVRKLEQYKVRFDQCGTMDDFDVTLQLLTKGERNRVISYAIHNQPGSNTPGGAAEYRTMDTHAQSAHKLKSRFPDFVTVVTKTTTTPNAWGGMERTDVRIAWKQAAKHGEHK